MREKLLTIHAVTPFSADIQIQLLTLDDDLSNFYYYIIQYKAAGQIFTDVKTVSHNQSTSSVRITLSGLQPGMVYSVRVLPVRSHFMKNISAAGWPTNGIDFMTGENMI